MPIQLVLLAGPFACGGEGEDLAGRTAILGRLIEVETGRPLSGRVTGEPDLGSVRTSTPSGEFAFEAVRPNVRYRLRGSAEGYLDAEVQITPRFDERSAIDIAVTPSVVCMPGRRQCARGGEAAVETCAADGRSFRREACASGQVCDSGTRRCVGAPGLSVAVTGSGSVLSVPSGILCPPTCERAFPAGTQVRLEARPFGDGGFEGWGSACAGTDPSCELTLLSRAEVEARFRTVAYRLTVDPRGGGRIRSDPEGIDCNSVCDRFFPAGSQVQLTAVPDQGREFVAWEQACSGSNPVCSVRLDEARSVRARFQRPGPTLEVVLEGPGTGRVTSEPAGIDCGIDCSAGFPNNARATLTASAAIGSRFSGWAGACEGLAPVCEVVMSAARTVRARFEGDTVVVSVQRAGTGSGGISSNPAGIDCGTTCAAPFPRGRPLTLAATPGPDAVFLGWSGACSGERCELEPEADVAAEARFEPAYLAPFRPDANCLLQIDFEAPDRLTPTCGAGQASAPGWMPVPSRTPWLGDALEGAGAPLDLGVPGPGAAPATVELTARAAGEVPLFVDHDQADPARAGWSVRRTADGRVVASTFDGAGGESTVTTPAGVWPDGAWRHVAVVASGGELSVRLDGQERGRVGPLRLAGSSSTAWVGAARTGTISAGAPLAVDNLRLSDRAR